MSKIFKAVPLASRMRPTALDEVVGQAELLGKNAPFRKMVEADTLRSAIFYGPAGTGKTTLAEVIAKTTKRLFSKMNATSATVKEIRSLGKQMETANSSCVLFVDECLSYNSLIVVRVDQEIQLLPIGYIVDNKLACDVLSVNEKSEYEWQPVISWSVTKPKPMIEIQVEVDGIETTLKCSEDHLIFTKNRGWVQAQYLTAEDELVSPIKDIMEGEHDFSETLRNMFNPV